MRLGTNPEVEKFRAEFAAFLDEHLPTAEEARERTRSSSHIPEWSRRWQRTLFDAGWLLPGQPPEYGGRNATLEQVLAQQEELSRRGIYHSFNPQGLGIIGASLLTFGTPEQKQRWAIPLLRGEMTASLGMSEPGAGSDLAGLSTRAVLDGDHFVVNGQKVWTSGAHDADVLLTFVRTDPDAPKHKAADMYLAIERARVLAYYAALTIAEDDPGRHRAAVMAKAAAGECQEVVYRNGTQLFGAMGFTWENELHVYLKRAVAANLLLGSATVQRKALLEMEVTAL